MKKLLSLMLTLAIGSAGAWTYKVHNLTDSWVQVKLIQTWTPVNKTKQIAPGKTENIETSTPGTCVKQIDAVGIPNPTTNAQEGKAVGLSATYKYSGSFGSCSGKEVFISRTPPSLQSSGVNVVVGGAQTADVPGTGTLVIASQEK